MTWFRWSVLLGGIAGSAGVGLGALNTHAFSHRLDAHALATLDTVSRYLLIHGLLLLVIAGWQRTYPDAIALKVGSSLAAIGIVLFCGGLSASTLGSAPVFGQAAPLGGSALMGAWLACAVFAATRLR